MGNQNGSQNAPPMNTNQGVSNQNQNQVNNNNGNNQVSQVNNPNTMATLKTNVAIASKKAWNKTKEWGGKAVRESKKLANQTDNIPDLMVLANQELINHIQMRRDTSKKIDKQNKFFDSFKNPKGIVYVTGWSVGIVTFGGSYRRGFMMKRFDNGQWSLPFAIQEFEGSAGFQFKATIDAMWYVIKTENEMKSFTDANNIKLGAGAQLALGNAGLTSQADATVSTQSIKHEQIEEKASTNASIGSAKGVAVGASVHAGTFQGFKKANDSFYQKDVTKQDVLNCSIASQDAIRLLAGHPNMPQIKQQHLQIAYTFVQTLNDLITIENQQEGTIGRPNNGNGIGFGGNNNNNNIAVQSNVQSNIQQRQQIQYQPPSQQQVQQYHQQQQQQQQQWTQEQVFST